MNHGAVWRTLCPPPTPPAVWPHCSHFLKERVVKEARGSTSSYNGEIMNAVASGIYHSTSGRAEAVLLSKWQREGDLTRWAINFKDKERSSWKKTDTNVCVHQAERIHCSTGAVCSLMTQASTRCWLTCRGNYQLANFRIFKGIPRLSFSYSG